MAFTTNELSLVNQSLGRIGTTTIKDSENGSTTCNNYNQAILHYSQTRDSLLRSYEWNFALAQAKLDLISTIKLDNEPLPENWIVGDTITGISSGVTAKILTVSYGTLYDIIYLSDKFTDSETITNAVVESVYWEGIPITWETKDIYSYGDSDQVVCGIGYPVVKAIAPTYRYSYQFQLPVDFDRMQRRHRGYMSWAIMGDRLLAQDSHVKITYVKKVTDPTKFDSIFTEVLILQLGLKLLTPLAGTQTTSFRQQLMLELKDAMARARTVCAAEDDATGNSDWNLARYGTGKVYPLDPTTIH